MIKNFFFSLHLIYLFHNIDILIKLINLIIIKLRLFELLYLFRLSINCVLE